MRPINFPETNAVYAENQPEYQPLPSYKTPNGDVVTKWELSNEDLQRIVVDREIWLVIRTFNQPLQPVYITADKSEINFPKEEETRSILSKMTQKNPNESQTEPKKNPTLLSKEGAGFDLKTTEYIQRPNSKEVEELSAGLISAYSNHEQHTAEPVEIRELRNEEGERFNIPIKNPNETQNKPNPLKEELKKYKYSNIMQTNYNQHAKQINKANRAKGFYEASDELIKTIEKFAPELMPELKNTIVGQRIALIQSEASEALEGDRKGRWVNHEDLKHFDMESIMRMEDDRFKTIFKAHFKDTVEDEIADTIIRLFDFAGNYNIDLDFHIKAKLKFNALREHKHGKTY